MVQLKPSFDTKQFSFVSENVHFNCYLLDLNSSMFIWIGDPSNSFDSLTLALNTAKITSGGGFSLDAITSSTLMGNLLDPFHQNLCKKLSAKFKRPVFLSLNVEVQPEKTPVFEKNLFSTLVSHL